MPWCVLGKGLLGLGRMWCFDLIGCDFVVARLMQAGPTSGTPCCALSLGKDCVGANCCWTWCKRCVGEKMTSLCKLLCCCNLLLDMM